ncbi:MAG: hypothetical protein HOI91_07810, partial [Halieaceae bacterium]|nr:hypothetical protein [Halieaceae bacterium]
MVTIKPQDPMGTLRKELQVAVVCSTLCLLVCAAAFGFIVGWEAAKAVLLGGAVILVPSVWIAKHVASVRGAQYATVVALVKLPLCGLGFALLFVLKPEIHAFAVFTGAATVLLALPIATG